MTRTRSNEGKPLVRYAHRHYAILFYSLLATLAAGPLLDAFGLDTRLLEILLGVNLLAAVIPLRSMSQRGLLLSAQSVGKSSSSLHRPCPDAAIVTRILNS